MNKDFLLTYDEHRCSLEEKDFRGALTEYARNVNEWLKTILIFDLQILRHCRSTVETRLIEARAIRTLRLSFNRGCN